MKKVGVFSDLHGDKRSLDLIVKTLKKSNVDSAMFLGDGVYQTLSEFHLAELNKSYAVRDQLRMDSPLRKDVLKGMFSDEQLQKYVKLREEHTALAKNIARSEYVEIKKALEGIDTAVLGGNWDYAEEVRDVFGKDFLDASGKQVAGLNVMGFSGGGSTSNKTARDQTLADNPGEQGDHFPFWQENLLKEDYNADLFISHVPFTYGEGRSGHTDGENKLKQMLMARKKAGLKTPGLYLWGHQHGSGMVKYDDELEGITINPGCSSRYHNNQVPTSMICNFDENNNLIGVDKYEIDSTMENFGQVRLVESYSINGKKVTSQKLNQVVVEDKNPQKFRVGVEDDWTINNDYAGRNAEELDLMLRRNFVKVQEKIDDTQRRIKFAMQAALWEGTKDVQKRLQVELAEQAKDIFNIRKDSYENEEEKELWDEILVEAAFKLEKHFIKQAQFFDSKEKLYKFSEMLGKQSSEKIGELYEEHIFKGLKGTDFQDMVELYTPAAFKRKRILAKYEALSLWKKSYDLGLVDSESLGFTGAYQRNGFKPAKRTKEQLARMFGYSIEDKVRSEYDNKELGKAITEGNLPVLKGDEGEYAWTPKGPIPIDDSLKQYADYTAQDEKKFFGKLIKKKQLPVFDRNGRHYFPKYKDGSFEPIDNPSEYGLEPGEYQPIPYPENPRAST